MIDYISISWNHEGPERTDNSGMIFVHRGKRVQSYILSKNKPRRTKRALHLFNLLLKRAHGVTA